MTSRIIKVGRGRYRTDQIITNTWGPNAAHALGATPHEHVTLETPTAPDTSTLAILTDTVKVWP